MKVLKYGVVISLLLVLVGGTIYILARPAEARAGDGVREVASSVNAGQGRGNRDEVAAGPLGGQGNGQRVVTEAPEDCETGGRGVVETRGAGQSATGGTGYRGGQAAADAGNGVGNGTQGDQLLNDAETHEWDTITGTVLEADSELLVATTDGEILIGMGQAFYREEQGFVVSEGDEVTVEGYYEDGEFKAGTVTNLSTGGSIVLRDAVTGRPMWAGRGNGQNRN